MARIRAAKQELEREARERAEQAAREKAAQSGKARDEAQRRRWQSARPTPDPEAKANLTDPDSRLMVEGATKAYVQGCNAHVAAQVERGMDVLVPPDAERRKAEEPQAANAPHGPRATAMPERLRNEEVLKQYRKRAGMVEPVFGITKEKKHFRRFLLRGIEKWKRNEMLHARPSTFGG